MVRPDALSHRHVRAGPPALLGAAGWGDDTAPRRAAVGGNFSLAQARRFDEFPVYALGDRHAGLPLTAVERRFA